MAQIIINIPDDGQAKEIRDNFCDRFQYSDLMRNSEHNIDSPESEDNLLMIPNTENRTQFMKRMIIGWVREQAKIGEIGNENNIRDAKYQAIQID